MGLLDTVLWPMKKIILFVPFLFLGCGATPGPDKSISGAILGAGWGAGAGAVIGNQVNSSGPGIGIGAGLGAAEGLLTGAALDLEESSQLQARREIRALKTHVKMNEDQLSDLRAELNSRGRMLAATPSGTTIFFDPKLASVRTGSAEELEHLADSIKLDYKIREVQIIGHSDDTGSKEQNESLSLARAKTVQSILTAHGVSADHISIKAVSTSEPIATNRSEAGRQLNRRVEIVLVR